MANQDQPKGFQCFGECLRENSYVASATIYRGDLVTLGSDGKVSPAVAGGIIVGLALTYAVSGDTLQVADAPSQLIIGQADETEIDAQTDIGNMCDILATAGNTQYRASRQEIDSSTVGTAAAGLQILRVMPRIGNALGEFVDVVCRINEHALAQGVGIAGV